MGKTASRTDWAACGIKEQLCEAQNWRCPYCGGRMGATGRREDYPTVEHVVPLSAGGADQVDNIVITCRGCNEAGRAQIQQEQIHAVP